MRAAYVLLLVAVMASSSSGYQAWEIQSATPSNWNHNGVAILPNHRVIIAGDDDILMSSDDDGATWMQTPSLPRSPLFSEDPIHAIQFVDANNGFAFGNNCYRTTNGGDSWQQLPFHPAYGIDFISSQTGFAWESFGANRTDDGAMTWNSIWPQDHDHRVYSLDFVTENIGLLSGEDNDVPGTFRTTDGGETWLRVSNDSFQRILHLDENVVIGTREMTIFRSTDGGNTWNEVFSDNGLNFYPQMTGLEKIDDDSIAVVDTLMRVWVSDDVGLTWSLTQPIKLGFGLIIGQTSRMHFSLDGQTGYLVGPDGMIFKTDDGGHRWVKISKGVAISMNSIVMSDDGVGVAAGFDGAILRTTDFGRTWDVQQQIDDVGTARQINDIQVVDENTLVMAVHEGRFYRSDDSGQTWQTSGSKDLYFDWDFLDVHFINESEGWMFGRSVGAAGVIVYTTDGGQSWVRVLTNQTPDVFVQGQMIDSLHGWALSPSRTLRITNDGWQTATIRILDGSSEVFSVMEFANANVGWICGYYGTVLKSNDGGATFQQQTLPGFNTQNGDRISSIDVVDAQTAYILSIPRGIVFKTQDGGMTWEPHLTGFVGEFGTFLEDIDALATGEIWLTGFAGAILASEVPVALDVTSPDSLVFPNEMGVPPGR